MALDELRSPLMVVDFGHVLDFASDFRGQFFQVEYYFGFDFTDQQLNIECKGDVVRLGERHSVVVLFLL